MSYEYPFEEMQLQPDDVVAFKEAFLYLAVQHSAKSGRSAMSRRAAGGRAWNHLVRRGVADLLIDAGQTVHPLWNRFCGSMPERSPLHFVIVPPEGVGENWHDENLVSGLVVRSLRPYAANVRAIMETYQDAGKDERRAQVARYTGGVVGDKIVSFWDEVCDTLLPPRGTEVSD